MKTTETKKNKDIAFIRKVPEFVPATTEEDQEWTFRIFNREQTTCKPHLEPNRRDFYLICLLVESYGILTYGLKQYIIKEPTLLWIHPSDVMAWTNLATRDSGYFCMIRQPFIDHNPSLKLLTDKYSIFSDRSRSVIGLSEEETQVLIPVFERMMHDFTCKGPDYELAIGGGLQQLIVETLKMNVDSLPEAVDSNYKRVQEFFRLLEKDKQQLEAGNIIARPTVQYYAQELSIHPNYLSEIIKKYTGQTVGSIIKNHVLEEAKSLLVYTDKTLMEISMLLGFSDQPNFSFFFKQKTGITPKRFRSKNAGLFMPRSS